MPSDKTPYCLITIVGCSPSWSGWIERYTEAGTPSTRRMAGVSELGEELDFPRRPPTSVSVRCRSLRRLRAWPARGADPDGSLLGGLITQMLWTAGWAAPVSASTAPRGSIDCRCRCLRATFPVLCRPSIAARGAHSSTRTRRANLHEGVPPPAAIRRPTNTGNVARTPKRHHRTRRGARRVDGDRRPARGPAKSS